MSDLIGQQLGNFEILSVLGKGGMATVYRARQLNIKREVAIKVIKPDLAESSEFARRFEREAETIASLAHPNILNLFDYGQQGDIVYLAMELLRGGSLAGLIRKGPLSLQTTSRILNQIASALDYAHGLDIIHRDLKPQNVLLDEQGNAYLTDFGLARLVHQATQLTQSGMAMGTPSYMAPEQWQGKMSLDARVDIYALGIMLFEMLTGQLPFIADTPYSMMNMHVNEPPPPLDPIRHDLPPGVEQVIDKALSKNRDERFQSAGELAQAFEHALTGKMPIVPPSIAKSNRDTPHFLRQALLPAVDSTQRTSRRTRPLFLGIGIVVLAMLLTGGSLAILSNMRGATATLMPSNATLLLPTVSLITPASQTPSSAIIKASDTPEVQISVSRVPTSPTPAILVMPTLTSTQTSTLINSPLASHTVTATFTSLPSSTVPVTQTSTDTPTASNTATSTGTPEAVAMAFASPTLTSIPCTVSTNRANTVAIRVGPGKGRGLRDYMAVNKPYLVTGQAQANDGSTWWKLQTDDGSDAWVAQADVNAAGDCNQAAIMPTPPVVFARPTATPNSQPSNVGSSGSGGGNPPPPTAAGPTCISTGGACSTSRQCCSGSCTSHTYLCGPMKICSRLQCD